MRNGQNKRMRGRNNNHSHSHSHSHNNNHRKSHNPMARVYESNGPEVKIRGNPAHIAEKYMQLARDAQTSGDPVSAENYFQHAEHYFRLIAAAQEQFRQANPHLPRQETEITGARDEGYDDSDGEDEGQNSDGECGRGALRDRRAALHPARCTTLSATRSTAATRGAAAASWCPCRGDRRCRSTAIVHHRRAANRAAAGPAKQWPKWPR